jgi:hypothetical protein
MDDVPPLQGGGTKSYDTLIDLPERAPGALVADKAYDSDAIRDDLKQRGIRAASRRNRTAPRRSATASGFTVGATASSGCSAISRPTALSPHDMTNSPIVSLECYISQLDQICPRGLLA